MRKRRYQRPMGAGFTLTELAVVVVIVSLLIGGLLVPLSAQVDLRQSSETRQSLTEIRDALLGYAAVKGRLPCPAPATTASSVAGAGIEPPLVGVGVCPNVAGVLPWATLGVKETDAWGRRYSYRVTSVFAQCVAPPLLTPGTPCVAPTYGLRRYHADSGQFPWADSGSDGIGDADTGVGKLRLPYKELVINSTLSDCLSI